MIRLVGPCSCGPQNRIEIKLINGIKANYRFPVPPINFFISFASSGVFHRVDPLVYCFKCPTVLILIASWGQ